MKYYPKVEKFVIGAFLKSHNPGDVRHFERTVYWLLELKPDADEALKIAAFSHDTERAFRSQGTDPKHIASPKGFKDESAMEFHQTKGAEIIADFLQRQNAPSDLIERVRMLISKHEVGGNDDQDLLKDADSISYFENQIEHFVTVKVKEVGAQKVREKFQWMFERITSSRAKEIARPMFEQALHAVGP